MTTTTTTTPTLKSATRRLLSISAAATIAGVGLVAFSSPAQAVDAGSTKVWVCKYVGTPGIDETLKEGKNPIFVDGNAADKDHDGQVNVGDQFADAQERSVIVQIGGENENPGCSQTPPVVPPTTPPTGVPTPGTGAPHTGGEDGDVPVGLVGGGVLLVGAALVTAEAERRRRAATHR
jgi:hypothetical protein